MRSILLSILILILLAFPRNVKADVAPPPIPPGSNPEPGNETTQVRMLAETVLIDIQKDFTTDRLGRAHFTAEFTMRNTSALDESMGVRFPLSSYDGHGRPFVEIEHLVIKVDGRQVSYRRINYLDPRMRFLEEQDVPWAEFDVAFPAGTDTIIHISYDAKGSGYEPITTYSYILVSGAGWKDTIGSADIILRLPYPASNQNVLLDADIIGEPQHTTPGGDFNGNEVRWHLDEFEPGPDGPIQDMEFAVVSPGIWEAVLMEKERVVQNPDNGEAWGRLGKLYKQIYLRLTGYHQPAPSSGEIYRLGVEAYEKCLSIKPDDAQWHAGFAELLAGSNIWRTWEGDFPPDAYRALEEIQSAIQLAPADPVVQEIAHNIQLMFPDGIQQTGSEYSFTWLTRTPRPHPPAPTGEPYFNPTAIVGSYQGDIFGQSSGIEWRVQLALTLNHDHSAEVVWNYASGETFISSGSWRDPGEVYESISLSTTDPIRGPVDIWFHVKPNELQGREVPMFYGSAPVTLKRVSAVPPSSSGGKIPIPRENDMPKPDFNQTPPTETPRPAPAMPTPLPQAANPLCGSVALIPLAGVIVLARKRR